MVETAEVADRIRRALAVVPPERLVVAPDCGMKYFPRERVPGSSRRWWPAPGWSNASSPKRPCARADGHTPGSPGQGVVLFDPRLRQSRLSSIRKAPAGSGPRWLAGIACLLVAFVAGGQVDASARTDSLLQEQGSCDPPRFHPNNGASDGTGWARPKASRSCTTPSAKSSSSRSLPGTERPSSA